MCHPGGRPGCVLCDASLGPIVCRGEHWRLVLNRNQNLLGKCFLVARRHIEQVAELTEAEWADLRREVARATEALRLAFQPDHFNYAFLQNLERHVHLHVIPRYAERRTFAGLEFEDPDYPGHYAVPSPARRLAQDKFELLAEKLREIAAGLAAGRRC